MQLKNITHTKHHRTYQPVSLARTAEIFNYNLLTQIILLFICSTSIVAQVEIKKCSKRTFEVSYINLSESEKLFFNPFPFLAKNKQKENKKVLRKERIKYLNDTIFIFFNDTSIVQQDERYNFVDSVNIKINNWKYDILKPKEQVTFKVYFNDKIDYSYFVIYYNFEEMKKTKRSTCRRKS